MSKKNVTERRQEIMETALKLFINKGYEKTTTNDILNALNLSRGGLYHHFSSKEDILDNAINTLFVAEIDKVKPMIESDSISATEKLKYLIEFVPPAQPIIDDVKSIIQANDNPTMIAHLLKIKLEVVTPLFINIIEQGIREGIFECNYPNEVSKISVILSTILFTNTMVQMTLEEFQRMVIVFQNLVEAIVGAKPGTFDFMKQSIKVEQ